MLFLEKYCKQADAYTLTLTTPLTRKKRGCIKILKKDKYYSRFPKIREGSIRSGCNTNVNPVSVGKFTKTDSLNSLRMTRTFAFHLPHPSTFTMFSDHCTCSGA